MCGILYVQSVHPRSREHDLAAVDLMRARGPDGAWWRWSDDRFLAQTSLHFAGDVNWYPEAVSQGFAFNGEIYNWRQWSDVTDGAVVFGTVRSRDWQQVQAWSGPWAWVYDTGEHVLAATDPACEKHLFQYRDANWHIISSEIAPILHYVTSHASTKEFSTKHYPVIQSTPWHSIKRLEPGGLYVDGMYTACLDHITGWRDPDWTGTGTQATEHMNNLLHDVVQEMFPNEPVTLALSGGLDSSLLRTYIPDADTVTIVTDKDPVSQFTQADQIIDCDPQRWADAFKLSQQSMRLPVLSWSLPGWWLVMQYAKNRVIFTGCGADEIFGGYPHSRQNRPSPYVNNSTVNPDLTQLYRDYSDQYLLDYAVQIGSVDQLGIDLIAGSHGRETRNPFMHRRIISFAQSLPRNIRTGATGKRILRDVYRLRTGQHYLDPKSGFAGHCNDSIIYIDPDYQLTEDRITDWKRFIRYWFEKQYA